MKILTVLSRAQPRSRRALRSSQTVRRRLSKGWSCNRRPCRKFEPTPWCRPAIPVRPNSKNGLPTRSSRCRSMIPRDMTIGDLCRSPRIDRGTNGKHVTQQSTRYPRYNNSSLRDVWGPSPKVHFGLANDFLMVSF